MKKVRCRKRNMISLILGINKKKKEGTNELIYKTEEVEGWT